MTHSCVPRLPHMCAKRIHTCGMTHSCVWYDSFICVPCLIHVWHDSFICVPWFIHMCDMTPLCVPRFIHLNDMTLAYVCYDAFGDMTHSYVCHSCVPWLIRKCAMIHSYVWHNSFICATPIIHRRAKTHPYVRHHSFIRVPWLLHVCVMTHSYVRHDSLPRVTWHDSYTANIDISSEHTLSLSLTHTHTYCALLDSWMRKGLNELRHTYEWVMTHTWMSHVTQMNESCYA